MKIGGEKVQALARSQFILKRPVGDPITFNLAALPMGFEETVERLIPLPRPKVRFAKAKNGKVLIGEDGKAARTFEDSTPEYLTGRRTATNRQMVMQVHKGLRLDDQLEFETQVSVWEDYASEEAIPVCDALLKELMDAGFSTGDLIDLMREINRVSNLISEQVADAAADFTEQD